MPPGRRQRRREPVRPAVAPLLPPGPAIGIRRRLRVRYHRCVVVAVPL